MAYCKQEVDPCVTPFLGFARSCALHIRPAKPNSYDLLASQFS